MNKIFFILTMACSPVLATTVILNDNFDDGNIDTNTSGIGTGFNTTVILSGASISESGSNAEIGLGINGGRRVNITSREGGTVNTSDTTRFEFNNISFSVNASNTGTGTTDRVLFGVQDNSSTNDIGSNPQTGLYIQIESDSILEPGIGNGGFTGTSTLFYEAADNTTVSLATFTFDTLDFTSATPNLNPTLSLALDLSEDSYALNISGDTVSLLSGSLSGNFTHDITTGFATAFGQLEDPGVDIAIDQIVITEQIPEPTSSILLLSSLGILFVRRRSH